MHPVLGWLLTFHFFSFSLVIFRAVDWQDALKVYKGMLGLSGTELWASMATFFASGPFWYFAYAQGPEQKNMVATLTCLGLLAYGLVHVSLLPNSNTLADRFSPDWRHLGAAFCLLLAAILLLSNPSEFIYFQF
jgi:hypothetical protein